MIIRGKLVAREPGAGDGFLPQHLPAVAVEGSDHLQQHTAHDDGAWAQYMVYNAVIGILQDCRTAHCPTYFRFVQQAHEEAKGPEVSNHILRIALHILLIEYVDQSLT